MLSCAVHSHPDRVAKENMSHLMTMSHQLQREEMHDGKL